MLYKNLCQVCGGTVQKIDDIYECEYCQCRYSVEKLDNYAETVSKLFDDAMLKLISNARKNLYDAVTAKYISSNAVHEHCLQLKKYIPDDFQANFYDAVVMSSSKNVASLIKKINVKEHYDSLDVMLVFLIKSLKLEYVSATSLLIENAYKGFDLEKYRKYSNMLEIEAEKLDNCVYLTTYPRDVFVAYSSKDIEKAFELVEVLEEQGLSCFISIRNLRHGAGAQENYEKSLQEAMDSCTSFVFVSSMNSRNQSCDALRVEIPYIKKLDFENAVGHSRSVYSSIPYELKRPRVEYRLEESNRLLAADRIVNEFFEGYERVYTPMDVAERVMRQSTPFSTESQMQTEKTALSTVSQNVKYCVSCLTECGANARFCSSCGGNVFANTQKEAELTKELNEFRKQRDLEEQFANNEEIKRQQAEEERKRREAEELKRKQAEEERKRREADELKRKLEEEKRRLKENANNEYELGEKYYKGNGVKQDFSEAFKHYKLSAEGENVDSLNMLGVCYYNGKGVAKNYEHAVKYYTLAAEKGHIEAQYNLGCCYAFGQGVNGSYATAIKWYKLSANKGYIKAQFNLGVCYANGLGVVKDFNEAAKWYTLAAEKGYIDAQYNLGCCYSLGHGVSVDYSEAVKWYTLAAEQGHMMAQYNLGLCYKKGKGVTQNYNEAQKWFKLSASQGNDDAKKASSDIDRIWQKQREQKETEERNRRIAEELKQKQEKELKSQKDTASGRESTKGLEFQLNPDGKSYTLTGKGTCNVVNIYVDLYQGKPVTVIGEGAFKSSIIKQITLGNSVVSIGNYAFYFCKYLEKVVFSNNIKTIGDSAFQCCNKLKDLTIPNTVTTLGSFAFSGCESITKLIIPSSIVSFGIGVFSNCYSLKSVTLPKNLEAISGFMFSKCRSIESIVIPDSVKKIGIKAFEECINLEQIVIGKGVNDISNGEYKSFKNCKNLKVYCYADELKIKISALSSAKVFYYSETRPSGNRKRYWHYVNGIPTEW